MPDRTNKLESCILNPKHHSWSCADFPPLLHHCSLVPFFFSVNSWLNSDETKVNEAEWNEGNHYDTQTTNISAHHGLIYWNFRDQKGISADYDRLTIHSFEKCYLLVQSFSSHLSFILIHDWLIPPHLQHILSVTDQHIHLALEWKAPNNNNHNIIQDLEPKS